MLSYRKDLGAPDTAEHLAHLPARWFKRLSLPVLASIPAQGCWLKGTWDLLSSPTEPHRRKPHQPLNYLKTEWVWGQASWGKHWFRNEARSEVQPTPKDPQERKGAPSPSPEAQGPLEEARYRTQKPTVLNKSQAGDSLEAAHPARV